MSTVKQADLSPIIAPLLQWYDQNARILPWRDDPTPYRVWISEIMLQQTRVEAVKPYFERFIAALPTIEALAGADEELLLKLWEGLGYYNRVRNLKKAALAVLSEWNGSLPEDYRDLMTLPGIGFYTAGSISSIAFDRQFPCVDGNVLRVITRLTAYAEDIGKASTKDTVFDWIKAVLPSKRAGDVNQSLMELGATVCLPNAEPQCKKCPLTFFCAAKKQGDPLSYPVKQKKKARTIKERTVFLLILRDGIFLEKRPKDGLLSGMWEYLCAEGCLSNEAAEAFLDEKGFTFTDLSPLPHAKHIFTHIEWHMTGFSAVLSAAPSGAEFAVLRELNDRYAVPAAFKTYTKIAKALLGQA